MIHSYSDRKARQVNGTQGDIFIVCHAKALCSSLTEHAGQPMPLSQAERIWLMLLTLAVQANTTAYSKPLQTSEDAGVSEQRQVTMQRTVTPSISD